jgi:regulator of protease activity HflC (stomatin/prohibitin superfamily)
MLRWTVITLSFSLAACGTMDVPMAHRGRMFDRTGPLEAFSGGEGFVGPVLRPGTYRTGYYDQIMLVDCSTVTSHDPLTVLTQDGVQFGLDIYVRYSANCDEDESVIDIMSMLSPAEVRTITSQQLFETYVRPAISSVVREVISPHRANEINNLQQELLPEIRRRFMEEIEAHEGDVIRVYEVSLSNLDFPATLDAANEQRAVQTIMRDTAVAERERVEAETATATARRELMQREGEAVAARIDAIGQALARNPDYLQYDLQERMPGIYQHAGAQGNMVITAPQPTIMVSPEQH